ncbi:hypothetical protein DRH13_03570 [Candidatus Woesebacteria bacterium]|nr:MAG: hypothetical protein DRH13_03570 [Candidatus Woesebacteria bacterium]
MAPSKWTRIDGSTDLLNGAEKIKNPGRLPAECEYIYQEDGSTSQVQLIGGKLVEVPIIGIPRPMKLPSSWHVRPSNIN